MAARQDTLWEQFLKPIVTTLIDQKELKEIYENTDWEGESDRFRNPNLSYPEYYVSQNFHGIENGYLNPSASVSYDPITQYALPPNETWVRQEGIDTIQGQPQRILDLGCGTGSTTILLKQKFPNAEVIGLDLSPYMLIMSDRKAKAAGLQIQWQQGNAEETGFPNDSFDVVTASLLLHETPSSVAKNILQECFRLLKPGGQVMILDGHQQKLRHTEWLTNIFEEPYIHEYAAGSVDAWMGNVGFEAVKTEDVWLASQVSWGMKPLPIADKSTFPDQQPVEYSIGDNWDSPDTPAPAY
ncbi:MAG: class I SAM-dependent methyltransferase [Halothece sp.]